MKLNLIYCKNSQHIIGINDDLLFTIPEDMKHFKNITSQEYVKGHKNIVIMGYNTWKSIPDKFKPLKDRINIVITNNHYSEFNGIDDTGIFLVFKSFELCYQFLKNAELNKNMLGKKFIIGGSQLYDYVWSDYFHNIDHIYETIINYEVNLDKLKEMDIKISEISFNIGQEFIKMNHHYIDDCKIILNKSIKEYFNDDYNELHGIQLNIFQNKRNTNHEEKQYLDLMKNILHKNNIKDSRNSKVISSFGEKMVFDLRKGFPLLTTKRTPFKTILRELLWFISGSTSNKDLNDKNVHIWDRNASKDFLGKQGLNYEEGELGPVYGFQWRRFGAEYSDKKNNYLQEEGTDQLQNIIDLINNDPSSRRIILSAWNPCDISKMALPPCHVMIQFSIDKEFIDAQLYQRSGDMFLGVPFNIASYSLLLHIIGSITGYIPRYFHHVLGDAHIYVNHISAIYEQIKRVPNDFPKLSLKEKITNINDINEDIFELCDYNHYPTIKAEMIA